MKKSAPKGKQGETTKRKNNIIDINALPSAGQEVQVEVITGVAPLTLLEPTLENLEALQFELLQAEQSMEHYRAKAEGLRKLISNMKPKVIRR